MRGCLLISALILATAVGEIKSAKILFFIGGVCSHSHRYGLEPLAIKMAQKGHNVTFFSPLKPIKPNPDITNICVPEVQQAYDAFTAKFGVLGLEERVKAKYNMDLQPDVHLNLILELTALTLKSPKFQQWVDETKFDLVVVDKTGLSDVGYAVALKHGAKVMSYTGLGSVIPWDFELYGIPPEASWIPLFGVFFQGKEMNFWARLQNELMLRTWRNEYSLYLERQDEQMRSLMNLPDMPHLRDLITSESVVLANLHYSCSYAKSLPPFIIPVGGMHLEESNGTLSKEIAEFVAKSGDEGFIYVSFGSIMRISTMPPALLQVFFRAFGSSKMRFLWKWEGEKPDNVPQNVLLMKWFPQNDVLAHPKIRGFISQGGQVSIQQGIFHGVPFIVFPVNGDQDYNAMRVSRYGNGFSMEFHGLTVEDLTAALDKITGNPTYKAAANRLKIASRERPVPALEEAVWWVDFVLRHEKEQLKLLKPLSIGQPWHVRQQMDVWAFIVCSILAAVGIVVMLLVVTVRFIMRKFSKANVKPSRARKTK